MKSLGELEKAVETHLQLMFPKHFLFSQMSTCVYNLIETRYDFQFLKYACV